MIAHIKTTLRTTPEKLWSHISQPHSLQFVSAPILIFHPVDGTNFSQPWEVNQPYALRLSFLGFLPLGRHDITLKAIDRAKNLIVSSESGSIAKVWNHTIRFEAIDTEQIAYEDEVEIRAGLLTIPVWLFAHLFYRHRQRRWKRLLAR